MSHDPKDKPKPAAPAQAAQTAELTKSQKRRQRKKAAKTPAGCHIPHLLNPALICRFADSVPGQQSRVRKDEWDSQSHARCPEEPPPLMEATRSPAMPGPRAKCVPATPGVRYWLQDTGCPVDLANRKSLPPKLVPHIKESEEPQNFDTANGPLPASQQVEMQVEGVPDNVRPYVLEDSPDVMTIGRRCVRLGYGFHWNPWSTKPYYDLPKKLGGGKLQLVSIGDVPYLADTWNPEGLKNALPAMPATFARKVKAKRASSCPAPEGLGNWKSVWF